MPNKFTNVTKTGYGGRIANSIKGVILGFVLFIASFGLLYWNEGRVDLSKIAKTSVEIDSVADTDPSFIQEMDGKFISTTGEVSSEQVIGDNLYLNPGKFIAVERLVEMYSWVEKSESQSKKNIGGSETTETTYTYLEDWKINPENSSGFEYPEGHENPQKSLENYINKVTDATIGSYKFDPQNVVLPSRFSLPLNSQNVNLSGDAVLANDSYIFIKKSEEGTFENPQIGDLRISYNVLHSGFEGTIFGKLKGNEIKPYSDQNGNNLYRLFKGTREQGISTFHSEYTTSLWILRLAGLLLMWFGLVMLFQPISVLLDILPIFGTITRSIIAIITFLVAFVLTIVTILISMIVHNLIALVIALIITIGLIISFFLILKNKKKVSGLNLKATTKNPFQDISSTNQLEDYVKKAKAKGMSRDEIRQQLLSAGWSDDKINKVLEQLFW